MLNKSTKDEQEFAGRIREKRLLPVVQTAARVLQSAHIRLVGSEQLTSWALSTFLPISCACFPCSGKKIWKNTDTQPYSPFIGQTQAGLGSDSVSRRLNLLLRLSQVGSHSVLILRPSTVHGNSVLLVWVLPISLACQPTEGLIKGCCLLPLPTII